MTNHIIEDSAIFSALRAHLAPAKLSQLIVDITNEAITDEEFRLQVADRLGVMPQVNETRPYDLNATTLRKIYPDVNLVALPHILKYAPEFGIITKKQMAAFIATCLIESNGFNAKRESFNYKPDRLRAVFPTRIASVDAARKLIAQGQVAVANYLYGGRYGNRTGTNDGWDYRGGGLIQNTFRGNYYKLQVATGIPFGDNPKLIEDMENSVIAAMSFWQEHGINAMAEKINTYSNGYTLNTLNSRGVETKDYEMNYGARMVRETVNGGLNGYTHFCQTLEKCLRYL